MSTYIRIEQTKGRGTDKRLFAMSAGIAVGLDVAMREAVRMSEGQLNAAIASMSGGDGLLSNYPRPGVGHRRMQAKGGIRGGQGIGTAKIGPVGPVPIVENDVNPHMIGLGRASRAKTRIVGFENVFSGYAQGKVPTAYGGRAKSRKRLNIGGNVVMGPVRHPGTRGKDRWKQTRDGPLRAMLPAVLRAPVVKAAMRPWGR